jgi:hypothetical protein
VEAFNSFPAPKLDFNYEGEISRKTWIFRGHQRVSYKLEPSIERSTKGKNVPWVALESMIMDEFRAKARMHMDVTTYPPDEKLNWLAAMQHFGIPTRLLDFTYSPYVALYFALRNCPEEPQSEPAAVWAIDGEAILATAEQVSRKADLEEREHVEHTTGQRQPRARISLDPRFLMDERDVLRHEGQYWEKAISSALTPEGIRRKCFNDRGFVMFALPPIQNEGVKQTV